MDFEKLMFVRGKRGVSLTEVALTILVGAFILTALITFAIDLSNQNPSENVDDSFLSARTTLNGSVQSVQKLTEDIYNSYSNITEANDVVSVAWNGFKGVLAIFLLPARLYDVSRNMMAVVWKAISPVPVPSYVYDIILIAITILIVFALLRFLTQRGNDA